MLISCSNHHEYQGKERDQNGEEYQEHLQIFDNLKDHRDDITESGENPQVIKRLHNLLHQNHGQNTLIVKGIEWCKLLHKHICHTSGAVQNIVGGFRVCEVI
jgi:hypothetical protein